MEKEKYTKARNLIVAENIDEFALATEKVNFNEEDLVAFITSLSDIYYWLNVESVWGKLGFKWSTQEGIGAFADSNIQFNIIPSIPDGHRIKEIKQLFPSSWVNKTLLKSNWENVTNFRGNYGNCKFDLTGAKFIGDNQRCFYPGFGGSVYLKADLKNVLWYNGNMHIFGGQYTIPCSIIIDDENKYLNIPSVPDTYTSCHLGEITIDWRGTGKFNYEYLFYNIQDNRYPIVIIENIELNKPILVPDIKFDMFQIRLDKSKVFNISYRTWDRQSFIDEILNHNYIIEFDTSYNNNEDIILQQLRFDIYFDIDIWTGYCKIPGIFNYINAKSIYFKFFREEELENTINIKISDHLFNNRLCITSYYEKAPTINIDCEHNNNNLQYQYLIILNKEEELEDFKCASDSLLKIYNLLNININYININKVFNVIVVKYLYKNNFAFTQILPKQVLNIQMLMLAENSRVYIPKECVLHVTYINRYRGTDNHYLEDRDNTAIYVHYDEDINIAIPKYNLLYKDNIKYSSYNLFNFDNVTKEQLKTALWVNSHVDGVQCIHPIVIIKNDCTIKTLNINNFYYIYCTNLTFTCTIGQNLLNQLIDALEPNDTTTTYKISILDADYQLLTPEQIEYITVTCNYVLVDVIS